MQTGQTGFIVLLLIAGTIPSCQCSLSEGLCGNLTIKNLQIKKAFSHSPLFSIPKTTFQSRLELKMSSFSQISNPLFLLNKNHLLVKRTQFKSISKELILSSAEQNCVCGEVFSYSLEIDGTCFNECTFQNFIIFNNNEITFSKCSFQSTQFLQEINKLSVSDSSFDDASFDYIDNLQKCILHETNFTSCSGCLTIQEGQSDQCNSIYCCYWDKSGDMILSISDKISINGMFIKDYQKTGYIIGLKIPEEDLLVKNSIFNMNQEDFIFQGNIKTITFENCCYSDKEKLFKGDVPTFKFINENSCKENVFIQTIDYKVNYMKSIVLYNREHDVDWSYDPH